MGSLLNVDTVPPNGDKVGINHAAWLVTSQADFILTGQIQSVWLNLPKTTNHQFCTRAMIVRCKQIQ